MSRMDVNDTVHTVRLQFDYKMQPHSEKIAPCERVFTRTDMLQNFCNWTLIFFIFYSYIHFSFAFLFLSVWM